VISLPITLAPSRTFLATTYRYEFLCVLHIIADIGVIFLCSGYLAIEKRPRSSRRLTPAAQLRRMTTESATSRNLHCYSTSLVNPTDLVVFSDTRYLYCNF
jgi:hypothetical protein